MSEHIWVTGATRADRSAAVDALALPTPLLPRIPANRRLRGPYTAAGSMLRSLVPAGHDEQTLLARHQIELLSVAPELRTIVPAAPQTLTSLAIPGERTRFYSAARTLRIAHGVIEFLLESLRETGTLGRSVVIEELHHADYTDQEFVGVLLRRIDPAVLTIVVTSQAEFRPRAQDSSDPSHPPAADLPTALIRFSRQVEAASSVPVTGTAQDYVDSDGTDDRAEVRAAYRALPEAERRKRHDARAAELAELAEREETVRLGALAFHLSRGTEASTAGLAALDHVMEQSMRMGFYDATLEACAAGRRLTDPVHSFDAWWKFTTKMPTSLSAISRGEEAEAICDEGRFYSTSPRHHQQLAYATAMLYTRHLDPERIDHVRATGWINQAIAFASTAPDPKLRALTTVFNRNGLALIEAHRRRPEAALALVSDGLAELDVALEPDEHALHRSVLRYNRAQVLSGLGRWEESLADYRAVIAVDPNYPEYHFDAGNLLRKLGRPTEAMIEYDEAIRLGPPFPEVFYNRADLLFELGDLAAARDGFDYVLELDPDHVDALINRAGLLADLGEAALAEADAQRGLGLSPGHAHLVALLGRLRFEAGRLDEATAYLDNAVATDPTLAEAWAVRGAVRAEQGRLPDALADLDRATELADNAGVFFNRGCVALELGLLAEAERDFTRFIAASPEDPDGWQRRAECRHAAGDQVGAEQDRRHAESLASSEAA